jgi:hypothetical protein
MSIIPSSPQEYGKAKIFFVDQSTMPSKVSPAQIDALCKENDQSKKSNEASRGEEIRLKNALQQCLAEPVDDELERYVHSACYVHAATSHNAKP